MGDNHKAARLVHEIDDLQCAGISDGRMACSVFPDQFIEQRPIRLVCNAGICQSCHDVALKYRGAFGRKFQHVFHVQNGIQFFQLFDHIQFCPPPPGGSLFQQRLQQSGFLGGVTQDMDGAAVCRVFGGTLHAGNNAQRRAPGGRPQTGCARHGVVVGQGQYGKAQAQRVPDKKLRRRGTV